MRILVTGGAGYIGSACLRWLVRHGHDAIAFDNLSQGHAAAVPEGRLIVGDIEDRGALERALGEHRSEAVMHFAAVASVPASITDPESYYRTNVVGTKNVLDAMMARDVHRIVFSSSAATYSFDAEMPLGEDAVQRPEVPYGVTKLVGEWMIKDYARAHGIAYVLLRYFNAAGADPNGTFGECRADESHLIPLILAVPLGRREKVLIYGDDYDTPDGSCIRDYIHVDDLAAAHQATLEALAPETGRIYNLGTGSGVSVLEVLRTCEAVVGAPIAHEIVGRRPGDPATLVASTERITRELGWTPAYPEIRDIVETAWNWHRSHPLGYGADHVSERTR
jgi:UDP-glucose 4-epimerase